jgi:hypothetical protein
LLSLLASFLIAGPAAADPGSEGGPPGLEDQLTAAASAYNKARTALSASQKRQAEVTAKLPVLARQVAAATEEVNRNATAMYKGNQASAISSVLSSASPRAFIDRASIFAYLTDQQNDTLHDLITGQAEAAALKTQLDTEILEQQKQLAALAAQKKKLEQALGLVGGNATTSGYGKLAPSATPAPRNSDGSWPPESCSVDDPTTSGCITPRTYHALKEAQRAGFDHYVSCYRSGGSGEHPKGRACDWAANKDGFAGIATGSDKTYGNNLAAWFLANADRLGVLYIIWFRQIWLPGIGWRAYHGDGTPSGNHENHVHMSME